MFQKSTWIRLPRNVMVGHGAVLNDTTVEDVTNTSVSLAWTAPQTNTVELANEARGRIRSIDDEVREVDDLIREFDPQLAQVLSLVTDSLSRTADYGGNIAESALQKAAPRP